MPTRLQRNVVTNSSSRVSRQCCLVRHENIRIIFFTCTNNANMNSSQLPCLTTHSQPLKPPSASPSSPPSFLSLSLPQICHQQPSCLNPRCQVSRLQLGPRLVQGNWSSQAQEKALLLSHRPLRRPPSRHHASASAASLLPAKQLRAADSLA